MGVKQARTVNLKQEKSQRDLRQAMPQPITAAIASLAWEMSVPRLVLVLPDKLPTHRLQAAEESVFLELQHVPACTQSFCDVLHTRRIVALFEWCIKKTTSCV